MSKLFTATSYAPNPGVHDESRLADGNFTPPWQYLLDSLGSLGGAGLADRQKKAMRILRDDGASYTVYDTPKSGAKHNSKRDAKHDLKRDSSWPLDLVPWLIDSAEWNQIEAGLQERAELFNLILSDIYGPRELVTRGVIPPEVLFGHRGFLRACHGIALPGEQQLIIHAADMMRAPDGSMRILADRTQAPSGAGYALKNRTVMSRVLPSLFRDSHVHRLASYFQYLRQKLISLAPAVAQPEIAVLTPGAYNETYFEHAYLANYLGFKLVQSSDLSVRNGHVWMKSLSGLTRVDVLLRRVDDYFCDQVELKGDSQLGIPGLLQVIRAGNVVVANPLGSGVLENPALLRYLPAISQHFLGRELRLATVKTWWCGERDDLQYVLDNFEQLIVKKVFRAPRVSSLVVSELNPDSRAQLREQIKLQPTDYVAQEKLVPSHMPVIAGKQLASRPVLLRSYAVAGEKSYHVMPGGLTRVGPDPNTSMISSQLGALSKDTWVLASEPEKTLERWPEHRPAHGETASEELPSRVVENLYWMGRYAERSENVLRLMRTVLTQINRAFSIDDGSRTKLLQAVTHFTTTYPGFIGSHAPLAAPEKELLNVIVNAAKPGSASHCIQAMLNCAEESRDLLSSDGQRIVSDIGEQLLILRKKLPKSMRAAPEESLNPLISNLLALSGITRESMLRGRGWQFFDTGQRLERASQIIALLQALLPEHEQPNDEETLLETLLMSLESLVAYRRHHPGDANLADTLAFILRNPRNPRSLLYQLNRLQTGLANMPEPGAREESLRVLELISLISLGDIESLTAIDESKAGRPGLANLLKRSKTLIDEISTLLSSRYFSPAPNPAQLVTQNWSLD